MKVGRIAVRCLWIGVLILLAGGMSMALDTLRIRGNRFYVGGRPIGLAGVNYISSCTKVWGDMWGDWYNKEVVEDELGKMEEIGINCIRVFFTWCQPVNPREGVLDERRLKRLRDFLTRAERHNIYVMLVVGGWPPEWVWGKLKEAGYERWSFSDIYVSPIIQGAFKDYLAQLLEYVGDISSLAIIDIMNEPHWAAVRKDEDWFRQAGTPAKCVAWTRWVIKKYGNLDNAAIAWGGELGKLLEVGGKKYLTPPEAESFLKKDRWCAKVRDYQEFVEDSLNRFIKEVRETVKAKRPQLLVTVGFGYGGVGGHFRGDEKILILTLTQDMRAFTKYVDFVSFHIYEPPQVPLVAKEVRRQGSITMRNAVGFIRAYCDVGKPVVLQEFGLPDVRRGTEVSQEDLQAAAWEVTLEAAYKTGCDGALGWMWCETDTSMIDTDSGWGIIRLDGKPKKAFFVLKEWVEPLKNIHKHEPDITIAVDRKSYLNTLQLYADGYKLWSALRRKGYIPAVIWKGEKARTRAIIELRAEEE